MNTDLIREVRPSDTLAGVGLALAVLALLGAAFVYWLVVPGVVLGAAAATLGFIARRRAIAGGRGSRDLAVVVITLGVVAILFTPVVMMASKAGEDWGRSCALDPQHDPNC